MRDRGQLAKFHEVSQDKQLWVGAATLTELFSDASAAGSAAENRGSSSPAPPGAETQPWHYRNSAGGSSSASAQQIAELVRGGQIVADTPIWREGFSCWLALRDVPELAGVLVAPPGSHGFASASALLGPSTSSAPPGSRTGRARWSRYFVIYAGLGSALVLAAGAFLLFNKYRSGDLRLLGAARPAAINSHMSSDIPRGTGLVVSGATVTNLKTGELVEIPGSRGTCFALNPKGYLLTNKHVVEEYVKLTRADATIEDVQKTMSCRIEPNLWVYFAKERYESRVVYVSGRYDIAVLKVDREGPYFRLASKPTVVQGTRIYAMGFPAASSEPLSVEGAMQRSTRKLSEHVESVLDESDYRYSITDGIVSVLRVELGTEYIQHSAPISGGNSGGPLVYEDGTVLGINTLVSFDKDKPGVGVKYYAISLQQVVIELERKVPELFAD
jgi:S1-C subfamily serine protease